MAPVHERKFPRPNAFLADRMASWFPDKTLAELTAFLESLSDEKFWETYREVFKANTSANLRSAALICAREGWFLDLEFPGGIALTTLVELILGDRAEEAWTLLEQYFEKRRPFIETELVDRFPNRAKLLGAFFRHHDSGDYDVAIPLALIQADGICHDIFGAELFRVRKNAPLVRKKIDSKTVDWIWDAAAEPLREALPLALPQARQSKKFNRHLILHGASLDYGTRRNSFRVMSLLSYLQCMAAHEQETRKRADSTITNESRKKSI